MGTSKPQQLCWGCKKATGGCRWSDRLKPVKGWVVEKTIIKLSWKKGGEAESYLVINCPEFISDKEKPKMYKPDGTIKLKNRPKIGKYRPRIATSKGGKQKIINNNINQIERSCQE